MARLTSSLLTAAVLFFVSAAIVLGNEIEHIASPMTHLALHDNLYTTIHTNVQRIKGVYFSGKVVGKFEKVSGGGTYNGKFRGVKRGKSSEATFDYKVRGSCKSMGFDVTFGGKVSGKMSVEGKRVAVRVGYKTAARGTVHGKSVKGGAKGTAILIAAYGKLAYREKGTARMYVDGKLLTAKYTAALNKHAVKVAVVGKYAGKPFFVKYSFSINLLKLGLDMNPMMIKRNYGTVYVTANGKTFTKKFDVKGMEMPKLM